jgi:hypothetical protein
MTRANYGEINEILMSPAEIEVVVGEIKKLKPGALVVEWGSCGSTCMWLESIGPSQRLISIEHNINWHGRVSRSVASHFGDLGGKFKYIYKPERLPELYKHGYGRIEEENPYGTNEYVFPDGEISEADLFIVDGIARGACIAVAALTRKNTDSVILLHDYSPRKVAYGWITQFFDVEVVDTMAILKTKKGGHLR